MFVISPLTDTTDITVTTEKPKGVFNLSSRSRPKTPLQVKHTVASETQGPICLEATQFIPQWTPEA